jgi:ribosome-associated protein
MIAAPNVDFRRIAREAARAAAEKKAIDILLLDVRKDSDITDYMLIAGADSSPQVRAIYEGIVGRLQDQGMRVLHQDGHARDRWIAIDYGGLLVHILLTEVREFYRLEHMWENPHRVEWEDSARPAAKRKK